MSLKDPATDLSTLLDGELGLELGTNLFLGPMPDHEEEVPAVCVALRNTGGPPPAPYLNGQRESYFKAAVQCLVRGTPSDYAAGEALARAVWGRLHLATLVGYVALYVREAQPVDVGPDASNRPVWTINISTEYVATVA